MGQTQTWQRRRTTATGESVISAISVGAVFILLGLVFVLALPNNLFERTINFFGSLRSTQVPNTSLVLLAPSSPSTHVVFYTAVFQFGMGIALLQVLILILRIGFRSPFQKTAETMGSLVFWLGASYLVYLYLNSSTSIQDWFLFWTAIIVVLGLSLLVRGIALLAKR